MPMAELASATETFPALLPAGDHAVYVTVRAVEKVCMQRRLDRDALEVAA